MVQADKFKQGVSTISGQSPFFSSACIYGKKKSVKRSYPEGNRPFDSIWACGKIKLEFSQLKEILR